MLAKSFLDGYVIGRYLPSIFGAVVFVALAILSDYLFQDFPNGRILSGIPLAVLAIAALIWPLRNGILLLCVYAMRTFPGIVAIFHLIMLTIGTGNLQVVLVMGAIAIVSQLRLWSIKRSLQAA